MDKKLLSEDLLKTTKKSKICLKCREKKHKENNFFIQDIKTSLHIPAATLGLLLIIPFCCTAQNGEIKIIAVESLEGELELEIKESKKRTIAGTEYGIPLSRNGNNGSISYVIEVKREPIPHQEFELCEEKMTITWEISPNLANKKTTKIKKNENYQNKRHDAIDISLSEKKHWGKYIK